MEALLYGLQYSKHASDITTHITLTALHVWAGGGGRLPVSEALHSSRSQLGRAGPAAGPMEGRPFRGGSPLQHAQ